MLAVSERALDLLAGAVEAEQLSEEQALRLSRTADDQFGLVLVDGPASNDQVVTRDDRPVLYVANEVATALDGATLDVAEGSSPTRLTLRVPEPGPGTDGASPA